MIKELLRKILRRGQKAVRLPPMRTSSGEFLLRKTDYGQVRVEFVTIEKIAKRALLEVKAINESEIIVESNPVTTLKIRLTATLSAGYSAPRASQEADKIINAALKESLGAKFYVPVEVRVQQILPANPKRRVR